MQSSVVLHSQTNQSMISILSALWIYGVLSAEPGSIAPQSQPLTKKASFLPSDVTANIVEYFQCDDTTLAHFSETNWAHYKLAKPLLIIREELHSMHSIERSLIEIIKNSRAKTIKIQMLDNGARREIEHYLDGFEGHIDWLMEYPKSTNQNDVGFREKIDAFQTKLARHRTTFPRPIPLHRREELLTDVQRELFDAFIVMKYEAMDIIEEQRRNSVPPIKGAEFKLLVEMVGVITNYPSLDGIQWRQRELSSPEWLATRKSVGDQTFDFKRLPAGQRWTAPLMQHLHDFVVRTREQRLAVEKLTQLKSGGVDE